MQTVIFFSILFTLFAVIGGFEVFRTYRFLTPGQEPATEFLPRTQTQWLGLILATVTLMLVVFMAAVSYVILHSPIGVSHMSINVIVASLISLVGFFVIWGNLKSIVRIRKKETKTRDYTIPYHAFQALGIIPMLMIVGLTFNHLPKDGLTNTIILLLLMASILCDILASKYKEPE